MTNASIARSFIIGGIVGIVIALGVLVIDNRPISGAIPMGLEPSTYRQWYAETAKCAQLPELGYYDIEWYVVPDVADFPTSIGTKIGLWEAESRGLHRITVAGLYQDNEMVVKHEMLHSLLNRFGGVEKGHPTLYFEERCHLTWKTWP